MSDPSRAGRWLKATWEERPQTALPEVYEALMHITAEASLTVMAVVTRALAEMKVSVLSFNSQKGQGDSQVIDVKIACKSIDHFNSIVSRMKSLREVVSVSRGFL